MSPAPFLVGWGAWITALAGMLAIWSPNSATPLLLLGGGAPAAVYGVVVWRRPGSDRRRRLVTDSSVATVILAIGAAVALLGTTAGLWLTLVGAEIVAFGLGALARELWLMRRAGLERPARGEGRAAGRG